MLLNLLDPTSPFADYYSRLYSVQLLSAVCAARPERLQECILSAPLGTSRLVGVLDDGRDAVRNAGLLLLVDLTSGANEDLRKIVAFEDVFGKIFALIQLEGGLAEAGITAQDCLSLLANLIKGSASNQTMFRESGCVAQIAQLLQQSFPSDPSEAAFLVQSREKASWGLLQLLRLFLVPGESGTAQNQTAFFKAGIAQILVDLGFCSTLPTPIRTTALRSAAALIEANPPLQEQFAALTTITPADTEHNAEQAQQAPKTNGTRLNPGSAKGSARVSAETRRTYIIEALLDLALNKPQADNVLRAAACGLTQAYLTNHDRIKLHFLQRAIHGHAEQEEAANVLLTLLHPSGDDINSVVFASWIVQDLVADNLDAKSALIAVREGNESEGEDVITCIQGFGSQLHASLQAPIDERLGAAYASLLSTLLWDFAPGVDDLLAEGSSLLQSLVALVKTPTEDPVVTGLAAALLGTVYEFSTKDSPISRRTMAPILQQKLGRTKYLEALLQLRRQPAIRDFDLDLESDEAGDGMVSKVFADLFALEYSRLRRAIDKDPGVEVLPPSAVEAGIDRDVLDELRQQIQASKDALALAQKEALDAGQKGEQDRMTAAKDVQTANSEVERLKKINQAMQQGHEKEMQKLEKKSEQQRLAIEAQNKRAVTEAKQEAERQAQSTLREKEAGTAQKIQEYERRLAELGNAHRAESTGHANIKQQLETLTGKHNELIKRERDLARQQEELQRKHAASEQKLQAAEARATAAETKLNIAKTALDTRGEEMETLQSQLKEVKDELAGREEELKTERAGFADLKKELELAKAAAIATEKDLKLARDAVKTSEKDLQSAQDAVKAAEKESKAAKDATKAAEKDAKDARDAIKAAEKETKDAKDTIKTLEKEALAAKDSTKATKAAEKEAKDAKDAIKAVEKEVQTAKEAAKVAEKDAKAAKDAIKALEKERDAAKAATKSADKERDVAKEAAKSADKGGNDKGGKAGGKKGNNAAGPSAADKEKLTKLEADVTASKESEKTAKEELAKLEADIATAKENEKSAQDKLEKLEADVAAAKESEKTAKEELAKLKADVAASKESDESGREKLAKLEADVAKAKEDEKGAKDELETMLLVLGDIEAKRDEYKSKVKELGGEVTDDDEEDDEDEDEDDEDGEEEDELV